MGSYQAGPCTNVSDIDCAPCGTCGPNQYQKAACFGTMDTDCRNLTICDPDQIELQAPTATSDRVCGSPFYEHQPVYTLLQPSPPWLFALFEDPSMFVSLASSFAAQGVARVSSLAASFSAPLPNRETVASVQASFAPSTVYNDNPVVTVLIQGVDARGSSAYVAGFASAAIRRPDTGMVEVGSCSFDHKGTCVVSLTVPDEWFGAVGGAEVLVYPGDSEPDAQLLGVASIASSAAPLPEDAVSTVLPKETLHPGELYAFRVVASFDRSIAAFSLSVNVSDELQVLQFVVDDTYWNFAEDVFDATSGAVNGIASDFDNLGSGEQLLCIVEFTVQEPLVMSPGVGHVSVVVTELADAAYNLLPLRGTFDPTFTFYDTRAGLVGSAAGAVYLEEDATVAVFATLQATVFNEQSLGAGPTTVGVGLSVLTQSGSIRAALPDDASCSVAPARLGTASSDCTVLSLGSAQTETEALTVTFSVAGAGAANSSTYEVEVLYAQDLEVRLDDDVLNAVARPPSCNGTAAAATVFQASPVRVAATIARLPTVGGNASSVVVDVTQRVAQFISINSTTAARLSAGPDSRLFVLGQRVGVAVVQLDFGATPVAATTVVVSEAAVLVEQVSVEYLTALDAATELVAGGGSGGEGGFRVNVTRAALLEVEGDEAVFKASVLYSDGLREDLEHRDMREVAITMDPPGPLVPTVGADGALGAVAFSNGLVEVNVSLLDPNCTAPLASGSTPVNVTLELPESALVLLSRPVLTPLGDPSVCAGVATEGMVQVLLEYADGSQADATADPRTMIAVDGDALVLKRSAETGSVTVGTLANSTVGFTTVNVSFAHLDLAPIAVVEIVVAEQLDVRLAPYPEFPGSSAYTVTKLSPIADTSVYQQAVAVSTLQVSGSVGSVDVSGDAIIAVNASLSVANGARLVTVAEPGASSGLVTSSLCGISAETAVVISQRPVYVTDIDTATLPSTLSGTVNSKAQIFVGVTLEDGTQLTSDVLTPRLRTNLPLLRFTGPTNGDSSVAVNSGTGELTLLANSLGSVVVTIEVRVGSNVTRDVVFAVNLSPVVGDFDIGSTSGPAGGSVRTAGNTVQLSVRVNTGTAVVAAVDVTLRYNASLLVAVSATQGSDWVGGTFLSTLNDPVGEISFGGLSNGLRGTETVVVLEFQVVSGLSSPAVTYITGTVNTLSRANQQGVGDSTPRAIVAGAVGLRLQPANRRRRSSSSSSSSNESSTSVQTTEEMIAPWPAANPHAMGAAELALQSLWLRQQRQQVKQERRFVSPMAFFGDTPAAAAAAAAAAQELVLPGQVRAFDRTRRATCPQRVRGDTNLDCTFDLNDVLFMQEYFVSLSDPGGPIDVTQEQLDEMDADMSGKADTLDALYLLRVNFRHLRFVGLPRFSREIDGATCRYRLGIDVFTASGPAAGDQSDVFVDVESAGMDLSSLASNLTFSRGSLDQQKALPFQGIVLRAGDPQDGSGRFVVEFTTTAQFGNLSISLVQATTDALGATSVTRSVALTGSRMPPFAFANPLELTVVHGAMDTATSSVSFGLQGYNPLLTTSVFSGPCVNVATTTTTTTTTTAAATMTTMTTTTTTTSTFTGTTTTFTGTAQSTSSSTSTAGTVTTAATATTTATTTTKTTSTSATTTTSTSTTMTTTTRRTKPPVTTSTTTTTQPFTIAPPKGSEDFFDTEAGLAVLVLIILLFICVCCCLFYCWRRRMPDEDDEESGYGVFGRSKTYDLATEHSYRMEHDTPNVTFLGQQKFGSLSRPPPNMEENWFSESMLPQEDSAADMSNGREVEAISLHGDHADDTSLFGDEQLQRDGAAAVEETAFAANAGAKDEGEGGEEDEGAGEEGEVGPSYLQAAAYVHPPVDETDSVADAELGDSQQLGSAGGEKGGVAYLEPPVDEEDETFSESDRDEDEDHAAQGQEQGQEEEEEEGEGEGGGKEEEREADDELTSSQREATFVPNPFDPTNEASDEDLYSSDEEAERTIADLTKDSADTGASHAETSFGQADAAPPAPRAAWDEDGATATSPQDSQYLDVNPNMSASDPFSQTHEGEHVSQYLDVNPAGSHGIEETSVDRAAQQQQGEAGEEKEGAEGGEDEGQLQFLDDDDEEFKPESDAGEDQPAPAEQTAPSPHSATSGSVSSGTETQGLDVPSGATSAKPRRRSTGDRGDNTEDDDEAPKPERELVPVTLTKRLGEALGFNIFGGTETGEPGIFVSKVDEEGPTQGLVLPDDEVLAVGLQKMRPLTRSEADQVLDEARGAEQVKIIVSRVKDTQPAGDRRDTLAVGRGKFVLSTPLRSRSKSTNLSVHAGKSNPHGRGSIYDQTFDLSEFET